MKLIARTFVLGMFAAAISATALSFNSTKAMTATTVNNQAVASSVPIPWCDPNVSGGKCSAQNGN